MFLLTAFFEQLYEIIYYDASKSVQKNCPLTGGEANTKACAVRQSQLALPSLFAVFKHLKKETRTSTGKSILHCP